MPHQARHIGRLAEQRIPNDVKIREAREAQRFADPVAAGSLDVAEKFGCAGRLYARQKRQHVRSGVLRFG